MDDRLRNLDRNFADYNAYKAIWLRLGESAQSG